MNLEIDRVEHDMPLTDSHPQYTSIATDLWKVLKRVATAIGHVQAWLVLTVFYFIILAPIALIFKLVSDPLHLRTRATSIWNARAQPPDLRRWVSAQ